VIAWGTGGFLVTLIVIGYFNGDFDNGREFLIALAVAAAVGVATAFWLRPRRASSGDDPTVFDERATRRAVRRGILRTAFVAVVWVVAIGIVVEYASEIWQGRGDREDHFSQIVGYGFFAGHPGFRREGWPSCCNTDARSVAVSLTLDPKVASPIEQSMEMQFRLDLRGRLKDPVFDNDLPRTGVDAAARTSKTHLRRLLRSLTPDVAATAVAELQPPLDVDSAFRLLARHSLEPSPFEEVAVYLQPADVQITASVDGRFQDQRVGWPSPAVAGFQAWVKSLRESDNEVLDGLGLPSVSGLRRIAERPRIYGLILDQASPKRLLGFLDDPQVRELRVGDIAFNLAARSG